MFTLLDQDVIEDLIRQLSEIQGPKSIALPGAAVDSAPRLTYIRQYG
jgi:hypothetical protein